MKKSITIFLTAAAMAAAMSVTAWAGEWKQDEGQWCYQNDDGTYAEMGWHWINGKCYSFSCDRQFDNPICDLNTQADIYYTVDLSGAWTVNGVAVEEGSELAQKLTGDNFSGTYISTYLEEDSGNYADNSCRLDIKMTTDGNTPPLFYLTEYYKKSDGSWEKINSAIEGVAGQSLDENGNPVLIRGNDETNTGTGIIIARIIRNGDTLQMIMDEGRTTYQKQN